MTQQNLVLKDLLSSYQEDRTTRAGQVVLSDPPPHVCRYCAGRWQALPGTVLDGHAVCVVSDEWMHRFTTVMRSNPWLTFKGAAELLGVSQTTVRAWWKRDEKRRRLVRSARPADRIAPALALEDVDPPMDVNFPPPGWTPEADRREEFADLSALTMQGKTQ